MQVKDAMEAEYDEETEKDFKMKEESVISIHPYVDPDSTSRFGK